MKVGDRGGIFMRETFFLEQKQSKKKRVRKKRSNLFFWFHCGVGV